MTAPLTPQALMESVLAIEKLHRTKGSYDYQACEIPPACSYCAFLRPWAAHKCEELHIERIEDVPDIHAIQDLGYICGECARSKGGVWPGGNSPAHRDECRHCKYERTLTHWTSWTWDDLDRDRRAKEARDD